LKEIDAALYNLICELHDSNHKSNTQEASNMKSTQNEKILQMKFETLIVGIDVGKETHYARAFDFRGLELSKLLRFTPIQRISPQ
jgi:hypothetical protein